MSTVYLPRVVQDNDVQRKRVLLLEGVISNQPNEFRYDPTVSETRLR